MKKSQLLFCFSLFTLTFSLFTQLCEAQYKVLHEFNDTLGGEPYGSLTQVNNLLYGMTYEGGVNNEGCIFSIDTNGSGFKDVLDFDGTNGGDGGSTFTISAKGDSMYTMTPVGGIYHSGCIFSLDTNGSGYRDIYDYNGYSVSYPNWAALTLSATGDTLFGMNKYGGSIDSGCVFCVRINGSGYTDLYDFIGPNGAYPYGSLTLSGKELYGLTSIGGAYHTGCIFSVHTDGSGYKDLVDFNGANGSYPYGSLTFSNGILYGMTRIGGTNGDGVLFAIDTNGSNYKIIFNFNGTDGWQPTAGLTLIGSVLYGMTYGGGAGNGNIFSIDTNGSAVTDIYNFYQFTGETPFGSVTISGNTFYGMTLSGGTWGYGVIFSFKDTAIKTITSTNNSKTVQETIKVYPNPSTGIFTLALAGAKNFSPLTIEVFNVLGEKVYSNHQPRTNFGASNYQIDLRSKSNGVYFYRVMGEDGGMIGEGKLVIEK